MRALGPADIPAVDPILMAAYESPRSFRPRLERHVALDPGGWLVAEDDGVAVGIGGATIMGATAYIGLVAVDPPRQGRGIARRIMQGLIAHARSRGCSTILLDASEAGRPLYEKLGFVADDLVGVWKREPRAHGADTRQLPHVIDSIVTLADGDARTILPGLARFDAAGWGDDRARVLASLAADDPSLVAVSRTGSGDIDGYVILQASTGIVGPLIANDAGVARALFAWALDAAAQRAPSADLTAHVPAANEAGAAIVAGEGFALARSLTHMRLGEPLSPLRRRLVYTQANLALG